MKCPGVRGVARHKGAWPRWPRARASHPGSEQSGSRSGKRSVVPSQRRFPFSKGHLQRLETFLRVTNGRKVPQVPASYLGADQDFSLKMVMLSRLRVILQASPCKAQWRRFQIPRSMLARPCSLYTCTYKTRNRALHPLWESVDLVPAGERQSPINIRWRDSVYDPGLKPLTISYDPTTCLCAWNNGYSFLVEFEDSADNSGESQTCLWSHLELKGQFHVSTGHVARPPRERGPLLLAVARDSPD
ncbi:carbonic anhydrase 5B, mitochondrial-like [Physeter macrocephalus]|uniref:Carbonic anhydrase 5B, mitochondrial-like n=1 Tax=Physeter macrocephalus TaxID=9755 RepID=A0A2Y9S4P5_PHYMC|nr:carbonic anhydrase 5B, mitochondrial-like [Physeter catodon]|eukprot:XP_023973508.2 carbonic anhydrase 5B, mitochondrial-like [Physeter catodon]